MTGANSLRRRAPTLPALKPRRLAGHKGDYGKALIVGGSRGMAGAVALAGMAALRGGAGLVRVATPDRCLETVAGFEPCYTTIPLADDQEGRLAAAAWPRLAQELQAVDVVACGPGLGRGPGVSTIVQRLYAEFPRPLVVDADGLNALAEQPLASAAGPRLLTPHPGEFARLSGIHDVAEQRRHAPEFAARHRVVLVLKGHATLITDGTRSRENRTGNPGMATGGAGDVLTGLLAALLAQGLSTWDAACLGVHLHGSAGDIAARRHGVVSLVARDLVEAIGEAMR